MSTHVQTLIETRKQERAAVIRDIEHADNLHFLGEPYRRIYVDGYPTQVFYGADDSETRLTFLFLVKHWIHVSTF